MVATELVYVSAAKAPMKPAELTNLLLKARANNRALGVSGMLLHHLGSFFQTLEGDPAVVQKLFARIERDPRHHRLAVLSTREVSQRTFGDWSMGFVDGAQQELSRVPGFNDFFRRGFELANVFTDHGRVRDLLLAFRDGRFRQWVDAS
jgi:hypothetical protein